MGQPVPARSQAQAPVTPVISNDSTLPVEAQTIPAPEMREEELMARQDANALRLPADFASTEPPPEFLAAVQEKMHDEEAPEVKSKSVLPVAYIVLGVIFFIAYAFMWIVIFNVSLFYKPS